MFKNKKYQSIQFLLIITAMVLFSCKPGPINLFKPVSPHQQYQRKLINAGLDQTAMGTAWINAADRSLAKALSITIPFKERGYFAAEDIPVAAYSFSATRGQKLNISLTKKPGEQFMIYTDVWKLDEGKNKLVASADTLGNPIALEIDASGTYLIRLQPELLRSGEYTLEITSGPSLGYPVSGTRRDHIQSFFGDGRDANTRKHEGIDLFAARLTPAIAIAAGTVVRVNENNLGGKVVWMRPTGKNYTLYYAHLDQQIAKEGQVVAPGDTLGLIGNTGNASTTAPHLHFGIYTSEGAIDPLPFVNPVVRPAPDITADINGLNTTIRTLKGATIYSSATTAASRLISPMSGTIAQVNGATANWYRIKLPDGTAGFIQNKLTARTATPLRKLSIRGAQLQAYDKPDSLAAVKMDLQKGEEVNVLGSFNKFLLISNKNKETGWIADL